MRASCCWQSAASAREIIQLSTTEEPQLLFVDTCDRLIVSILVFLTLFSPLAYGGVDPWAYNLIRLGVLIMLVAWLLRAAYARNFQASSPSFKIPALLFLALLAVQLVPIPLWLRELLSPVPLNHSLLLPSLPDYGLKPLASKWTQLTLYPPATWEALIDFSTCLALVWVVLNAIRPKDRQRTLLLSIVGIGSFQAIYGLFEYLSGRQGIFFINKMHYREDVTGTYINHNHFAGLIELAIPILVALLWAALPEQGNLSALFSKETRPRKSSLKILALVGLLGAMLVSLVLSHSRGGVVSMGISLLVLIFLLIQYKKPPVSRMTALILAAILLVVVFLSGELISRFSYSFRDAPERIALWKDSMAIVRDFPLWGTGLGTFKYVLPNYRHKVDILLVEGVPRQASWNFAHNDYLQLLIESGILGLVLTGWAIIFWFRQFLSELKTTSSVADRIIRCGLGCSVIAMLIHSFVDFNLRIPANAILFTVCLSLATSYGSHKD